MLRSYKYRLYPTPAQAELINRHIGACRFIYNLALEAKQTAYTSAGKNISCFDLIRQITDLKKDCVWLKEISIGALQQSVINLDKAYTGFFKGASRFPNYHSKHRGAQSFRIPHPAAIKIKGDKVVIPKFREGIRFVQDRPIKGEIRNSTISHRPSGKYYISLLVETGKDNPLPKKIKESTTLGIDLGLKHFIVTSDGDKIDNPKYLNESLKKLQYIQRQTSKKKKGSANRKKSQHKVALIHEKIAFQRKDFLHKLSSRLVSENQTLAFEDLNIGGMVRNHSLARSISDTGWGMFVDMCKYKAEWNGKNILQIGTFEPSTKMCSCCGRANHDLTLKDRKWTCECGTTHDRDINAAINIKNFALKNNRGEVRRKKPVELPTLVGAMKQEIFINN